jgi:beta-lactamase superfamily II metal-dependent hydrolase
MLPAEDGDCLLIEAVGADNSRTTILIDGGRYHTYSSWVKVLRELLGDRAIVDLLVVTHVDADHIGGALALLEDAARGFDIRGIWFNGHQQVKAAARPFNTLEPLGVAQADELTKVILAAKMPWNRETEGGPLHNEITTPKMEVGHFSLTVLTPGKRKLASMAPVWQSAVAEATTKIVEKPGGLERFGTGNINVTALAGVADENDSSRPNGSSIGLLAEAFGTRLLLAGDCHPDDLGASLSAMRTEDEANLSVDVFKISHHGARKNTTSDLLKSVNARIYAISTNGRHGHPDDSTLAKIITVTTGTKTLGFNYRTKATEKWDDDKLKAEYEFDILYPRLNSDGYFSVELGYCASVE